ncbi:MAG TPA: hypothetical protein ENN80_03370, partial [Candidatus Hydrogenedentes bacterium]|nr:hypothetical protein [Candidatus Hydrogenedentota bacterium]
IDVHTRKEVATITVTQAPGGVLLVTPDALEELQAEAGTVSFAVSNAEDGALAWSAAMTTDGNWISITSGANGDAPGTVELSYTENDTTQARTATLEITSDAAAGSPVEIIITQMGRGGCGCAGGTMAGKGAWSSRAGDAALVLIVLLLLSGAGRRSPMLVRTQ